MLRSSVEVFCCSKTDIELKQVSVSAEFCRSDRGTDGRTHARSQNTHTELRVVGEDEWNSSRGKKRHQQPESLSSLWVGNQCTQKKAS